MILYGKLIKKNMPLKTGKIANNDLDISFHDVMEASFILLCKELDIPVPIWLAKNTREIGRYGKTYFNHEQFIEEVYFDKFVLEIEV
jgi:hypothetical protein